MPVVCSAKDIHCQYEAKPYGICRSCCMARVGTDLLKLICPAVVDVVVDPAGVWPDESDCCGGDAEAEADDDVCFCAPGCAPLSPEAISMSISAQLRMASYR